MALQLYKIASIEVSSAGSSFIQFSNIPAGYTDLKIELSCRDAGGAGALALTLNSTGASIRRLYGNGNGSKGSDTYAPDGSGMTNSSGFVAGSFSSNTYYIPNYTSSTQKAVSIDGVQENTAADTYMMMFANLINTTSAVTTLRITPNGGSGFAQYTVATLYGIL
jgi:hypothetical protein